jgi:hypothetical protein
MKSELAACKIRNEQLLAEVVVIGMLVFNFLLIHVLEEKIAAVLCKSVVEDECKVAVEETNSVANGTELVEALAPVVAQEKVIGTRRFY